MMHLFVVHVTLTQQSENQKVDLLALCCLKSISLLYTVNNLREKVIKCTAVGRGRSIYLPSSTQLPV